MLRQSISLLMIACFIVSASPGAYAATGFTNVAATVNLNTGGDKDGGVTWGDFDNDGCLDVLVNTNDVTIQTRLYRSDCNVPDPAFTDVTATHAAGLLLNGVTERSAIWGDANNDGFLDFAVNTSRRVEIYLNRGPSATPPYSFGDASQNPNQIMAVDTPTAVPGGQNVEGMGWADYDGDGDLDLVIDNHNFGIDIYANDGAGNFTHVTPNANSLGLPTGGTSGDYLAVADIDGDGDIDILGRKENAFDLWINQGGTFTANTSFNEQATNQNKGGVAFCDFDNDADFDLFWSDGGNNPNQIWLQDNGSFTASGLPSGVNGNIDGVACGDVDNDGDLDLFLTSDGADLLFINNLIPAGTLSFTQQNLGISGSADGEGVAMADYDRDGDLDVLINQDGANELWRNTTNDNNYLMVRALRAIPEMNRTREDIGATVTLLDSAGNRVSGIREVNGGRGHGSQDPAYVHFGLPGGAEVPYIVRVQFVGGKVVQKAVVPNNLTGYQLVEITNTDADDLSAIQPQSNPIGVAKRVTSVASSAPREYRVTYEITVENLGDAPLNNIRVTDNLSSTFATARSFVVNSVSAAGLTTNPAYDGVDDIDLLSGPDSLAADQQTTIELEVTVTLSRVSGFFLNTAVASATGPNNLAVSDQSTDGADPDPDQDGDPTNNSEPTAVSMGLPVLIATKTAALVGDADGNSSASPGDTLEYTIILENAGAGAATGVIFTDNPDRNTTLETGSVTTTQGAITSGNRVGDTQVSVAIGAIAALEQVTVTLRVRINDPFPAGATAITNRGAISGSNVLALFTDDPNTAQSDDATTTVIGSGPGKNPNPDPNDRRSIFLPIIFR